MHYSNKKYPILLLGPDTKRLLLDNLNSKNFFYFSPEDSSLVWNFSLILNIFRYFIKLINIEATIGSKLKSAYFTALIKVSITNLVITPIDNNIHFYRAARILHKELRFIAIQNGIKFYKNKYFYPRMKEIFIPELVCFGEYDQDLLSSGGAQVGRFRFLGSAFEMKARDKSNLYKKFRNDFCETKYDICLVSEDFTGWNIEYPNIEETAGIIAEFSERYCRENGLKLVIAMKNKPRTKKGSQEIDFYSRFLNLDSPNISISSNSDWWSSYDVAMQSKLSIGMASSLILENASRGLKSVICDYYGEEWSIGAKYPLAIRNSDLSYKVFESDINKLMEISHEEYLSKISQSINYYIFKNKNKNISLELFLNSLLETDTNVTK